MALRPQTTKKETTILSRTRKTAKQAGERRVILVPASKIKTGKPEGSMTSPLTFQIQGTPAPQGSKQ